MKKVMMAKRVMDRTWKIVWRWRGRVGNDVWIPRQFMSTLRLFGRGCMEGTRGGVVEASDRKRKAGTADKDVKE